MSDRIKLDFTGMKPSDALRVAHLAFPEVAWEWEWPRVRDVGLGPCGCAAALICYATGIVVDEDSRCLNDTFPDIGVVNAYWAISITTIDAKSFPEAADMLEARGW